MNAVVLESDCDQRVVRSKPNAIWNILNFVCFGTAETFAVFWSKPDPSAGPGLLI